jgi:hypothetical protein
MSKMQNVVGDARRSCPPRVGFEQMQKVMGDLAKKFGMRR